MQKILIGENFELHCGEVDFVDILNEVYGNKTDREWIDLLCSDEFNFRIDEKFHKAIIQRNYIIPGSGCVEDKIFKIIEIPDDIQWEIRNYECAVGEYICEKHRIWN
jgi:hypothetical protein